MRYPTKAIILAAGFGTRMLPLSLDLPKPMMPFWGKPILAHLLAMLARWGVRDVLINLHHQPDQILGYLRGQRADNLRVALSFEPDILGTGGALRRASWFLDAGPFWMINADVVADLDPAPLCEAFASSRCLAALWLHPELGPRTVEMARGFVSNFQSSRPGTGGTFTFCGLHMVSPDVLRYIPEKPFSSIIQAYGNAMTDGRRIRGVCLPSSFWADVGTPDSYLQAHREALARHRRRLAGQTILQAGMIRRMTALKRRGVIVKGFAAIGADVEVAPGALLSNAVIWDGARIAADAVIANAVVGTRVHVNGRVPRVAVRSAFSLAAPGNTADIPLAMALQGLRWPTAETTVIPFEPRGSARHFTRLESRGRRVILVRYSLEREENGLYSRHARFLKSIGLPAPAILLDAPAKNFFVMQDLGDQSLQSLAKTWPQARLSHFYQLVLASIARWHTEGGCAARRRRLALVAPFSPDLYRWEREFFIRNFLQPRLHPAPETVRQIADELAAVSADLLKAPAVLVHRDLQSSNILRAGRRPFFIDFQGMRFGAAAYDLASLLCDPYIELPLAETEQLLDAYNRMVNRRQGVSGELFWLAAIERLAQALGAYGRLGANPETAWFGKYIAPGLRMMRRAIEQSGACPRLASLLQRYGDKMN